MTFEQRKAQRARLNAIMEEQDNFFKQFGDLDDLAYTDGAIPKKEKELMGLAISVVTRCDECITYHIGGCLDYGATKEEIVEAIRMGVVGGGSITRPNARFAFSLLEELGVL